MGVETTAWLRASGNNPRAPCSISRLERDRVVLLVGSRQESGCLHHASKRAHGRVNRKGLRPLTPSALVIRATHKNNSERITNISGGARYRCLFVSSAISGGVRGTTDRPCLGAGLAVGLVLGPGSDLSEEPVYQGVSRPRWNQSRPWVSSRTHHLCQVLRRRASARRRR